MAVFARRPKKVAVIYYPGGRKAGFHCTTTKRGLKFFLGKNRERFSSNCCVDIEF